MYSYSLKQGINDGFLTPFKVVQIATTVDDYVHTPDDEVTLTSGFLSTSLAVDGTISTMAGWRLAADAAPEVLLERLDHLVSEIGPRREHQRAHAQTDQGRTSDDTSLTGAGRHPNQARIWMSPAL